MVGCSTEEVGVGVAARIVHPQATHLEKLAVLQFRGRARGEGSKEMGKALLMMGPNFRSEAASVRLRIVGNLREHRSTVQRIYDIRININDEKIHSNFRSTARITSCRLAVKL